MLLPVAVILLGSGTWYAVSKRTKNAGMTAERKVIFDQLINQPQDPDLLREMADVFDKHGLKEQGALLRKRANLRELPPETKETHKQIFREAMASKDPAYVLGIAVAFDKQGATGNAAALRKYAAGLKTSAKAA